MMPSSFTCIKCHGRVCCALVVVKPLKQAPAKARPKYREWSRAVREALPELPPVQSADKSRPRAHDRGIASGAGRRSSYHLAYCTLPTFLPCKPEDSEYLRSAKAFKNTHTRPLNEIEAAVRPLKHSTITKTSHNNNTPNINHV